MTQGSADLPELIEYEQNARAWEVQIGIDAKSANSIFDRLHVLAKELCESSDGRLALAGLLSHNSAGVRLLAATECLAWIPSHAVPVLVQTRDVGGPHAIAAKYTLRSFESGTLDLDW